MDSLIGMLTQHLGGQAIEQISKKLGVDKGIVGKAITVAIPMIIAALAKNASRSRGAESLANAVERDHDGGIFGNLGDYLGGPKATQDDGILKHVFGSKRSGIENILGQMSGLNTNQAGSLLNILAPMVMGMLGKTKKDRNLDAGGLAEMLGQQRRHVPAPAPANSGMLDGLLGMLDADRDGSYKDDLLGMGASLLGGVLSRR